MNILIIHNIYSSVGGEENVVIFQKQLLESKGHNVKIYSREYNEMNSWLFGKVWGTFTSIYNSRSKRDLNKIIKDFSPQVVILHNLLPIISPSIIPFLNHKGIKIWQIVHNYRLLCPIGIFFSKGKICEKCLNFGREWNCLKNNCTGNYIASFSLSFRTFFIRKMKYYCYVDTFYTLSLFQKQKLIDNGISKDKIKFLANTYLPQESFEGFNFEDKQYISFVGRLTKEKGLFDFIELAKQMPQYSFLIAGEKTKEIENIYLPDNIQFEGFLNQMQMVQFYKKSKLILFLSRWYEGFPLVLLEAMYYFTPLIVNNLSVMAEVVENKKEGFVVEIGDLSSIKQHIEDVFNNQEFYRILSFNSRKKYEEKYSVEKYYNRLMQIEND